MQRNIVVSKVWFVRSLYPQHQPTFVAIISSLSVFQVRTKKHKTGPFNLHVNPIFSFSSGHINCDTVVIMNMLLLNEFVYCFNNVHNRTVMTGFQVVCFSTATKEIRSPSTKCTLTCFRASISMVFPRILGFDNRQRQPALKLNKTLVLCGF